MFFQNILKVNKSDVTTAILNSIGLKNLLMGWKLVTPLFLYIYMNEDVNK